MSLGLKVHLFMASNYDCVSEAEGMQNCKSKTATLNPNNICYFFSNLLSHKVGKLRLPSRGYVCRTQTVRSRSSNYTRYVSKLNTRVAHTIFYTFGLLLTYVGFNVVKCSYHSRDVLFITNLGR